MLLIFSTMWQGAICPTLGEMSIENRRRNSQASWKKVSKKIKKLVEATTKEQG